MRTWSEAEVRALGVTTDILTAGSVLGLSRNATYRLNAEGRLGVPVLRLGSQYRVPVSGLLQVLGLPPSARGAAADAAAFALHTTPAAARRAWSHGDGTPRRAPRRRLA